MAGGALWLFLQDDANTLQQRRSTLRGPAQFGRSGVRRNVDDVVIIAAEFVGRGLSLRIVEFLRLLIAFDAAEPWVEIALFRSWTSHWIFSVLSYVGACDENFITLPTNQN